MKSLVTANEPLVSIVMPSFNQVNFIERSIRSVLNQSYQNYELIIVDGGSTDGTLDVINRYRERCAHVVIETDRGQSDALNKGFAIAKGDIYGWINSDDLYEHNSFEVAIRAFLENPDAKVVFGDWNTIDESDCVIERYYAFDFSLTQHVIESFQCNAQSMFWRRSVHDSYGRFDISLHKTMDYEMILAFGKIVGNHGFLRVDSVFGNFRRHEAQKSRGWDLVIDREHYDIAKKHNTPMRGSIKSRMLRPFFRIRRAVWYVKRAGIRFAATRALRSVRENGSRGLFTR